MINRVLIRIKVIQILYSYLLTRNDFKIEPAQETTSRDRRYAYTVYMRLLLLILELSGYNVKGGREVADADADKVLHGNRMTAALASNDVIRRAINTGTSGIERYDTVVPGLLRAIRNSDIYKTTQRARKRDVATDVRLWATLLATVIGTDEALLEASRQDEGFTMRGLERGVQMAIDTLNSYSDNSMLYSDARTSLSTSLGKAYELYMALLNLPVELTRLEEERIEAGRHKHLPTPEDLNPNTRMIDNAFVAYIREHDELSRHREKNYIEWSGEPIFLRNILEHIHNSEIYRDYMSAPTTDMAADCEFWRQVMRNIILPSDELAVLMEDKSVFWNDDLEIVGTFVVKSMRRLAQADGAENALLPPFKNEEDERFGDELFRLAIEHRDEYRGYIDRFIDPRQWDSERLAFMDIVIMITAIAEILHYPLIPVAVSLNEYIEIANSYSTPRSGQFINGILYSILNYLRQQGLLHKEF